MITRMRNRAALRRARAENWHRYERALVVASLAIIARDDTGLSRLLAMAARYRRNVELIDRRLAR